MRRAGGSEGASGATLGINVGRSTGQSVYISHAARPLHPGTFLRENDERDEKNYGRITDLVRRRLAGSKRRDGAPKFRRSEKAVSEPERRGN